MAHGNQHGKHGKHLQGRHQIGLIPTGRSGSCWRTILPIALGVRPMLAGANACQTLRQCCLGRTAPALYAWERSCWEDVDAVRDEECVRALWSRACARGRSLHLHVRVHVLSDLYASHGGDLPQLWRRARTSPPTCAETARGVRETGSYG
jgi:hypothetical protein